jgi:hypothetical protein
MAARKNGYEYFPAPAGFGVVFGWFGAGLGRVWFGYWFGAVLRWVTNPNDSKTVNQFAG